MGNLCSSSDAPKALSPDRKTESMVKYEDPEVEDDDSDVMAEGQEPSFVVKPKRRAGVSAGSMDQTATMPKKVVDKSDEDRATIEGRLKESFLFESLDKDALKDVVDGVEIKNFAPGDVLMKQGDDGDYFYIVEEGEAQIFVKVEDDEKMVKEVGTGGSFGELALMYDAPRNATIKAKTALKCWAVARDTFKMTLMTAANNKRDRHKKFIDDVPILAELNPKEKLMIADALVKTEVEKGNKIITEGEEGNMFYIIEEGTVSFTKGDEEVGTDAAGGYFGEIALLTNEKRQVSVTCTSDCVLLSLDRATFVRVMGPLEKILKRNMETYKKIVTLGE